MNLINKFKFHINDFTFLVYLRNVVVTAFHAFFSKQSSTKPNIIKNKKTRKEYEKDTRSTNVQCCVLEVQRATRAITRFPRQIYLCLSLTRRHDITSSDVRAIQRNVSISFL